MRVDLSLSSPLFFPTEDPLRLILDVVEPENLIILDGAAEINVDAEHGTQPGGVLIEIIAEPNLALSLKCKAGASWAQFRLDLMFVEQQQIWVLYAGTYVDVNRNGIGPGGSPSMVLRSLCGVHLHDYDPVKGHIAAFGRVPKDSMTRQTLWDHIQEDDS